MQVPVPGDRSQEATENILHEQLLAVHTNVLDKINEALERIQNGTYGKCIACGINISEDILKKEPWTEHCVNCPQTKGEI